LPDSETDDVSSRWLENAGKIRLAATGCQWMQPASCARTTQVWEPQGREGGLAPARRMPLDQRAHPSW